jgi:hypothetical protein
MQICRLAFSFFCLFPFLFLSLSFSSSPLLVRVMSCKPLSYKSRVVSSVTSTYGRRGGLIFQCRDAHKPWHSADMGQRQRRDHGSKAGANPTLPPLYMHGGWNMLHATTRFNGQSLGLGCRTRKKRGQEEGFPLRPEGSTNMHCGEEGGGGVLFTCEG